MTVVAEKIIRIDVVASANAQRTINALATDMKKVETAATGMQRTMKTGFGGLNSVLTKTIGFLGAFGVTVGMGAVAKWVIESANAYQVLESRLTLVLGGYEKAERATEQIAAIAKTTGREIDAVSKLYEKASRAAQQFGISEENVRMITLGFSQSIRLSGAGTQEAYASLVQFGQALASGRLQGDEFRSLMENNAVFMYEFAKAAGVTVSEMRRLGTEGKLNAKFLFDTMTKEGADGLSMMERLDKMAKEIPLTFGQSMTSLVSASMETVGVMAKLFGNEGADQMGIFAPWIHGLSAISDRLRDVNALANAMDESSWRRLFRAIGAVGPPGGMKPGETGLFGGFGGTRDTLDSLKKETISEIEKLQNSIARDAAWFRKQWGGEDASFPAGSPALPILKSLNERRQELDGLLVKYASLRSEERKVMYGDGFYAENLIGTEKPEPDPNEVRRLETARKSLENFAAAKKREADAVWALVEGREEEQKTATALTELTDKLREAQVKGNGAQAEAIRLDIRRAEQGRKLIDERRAEAAAQEKMRDEEKTILERLDTQILRDTEALDALRNKTKATDEFTEAVLRRNRAEAVDERFALASQALPDAARLAYLNEYIDKLDKARTAKSDLLEGRASDKQSKEQGAIDASNVKRVDDLAEDINRRLKAGVISSDGKSVGEALKDNITEAVGGMTVDIVLNPITSVFSHMLAQLADQFSLMLTKSIYEQIASNSSDTIGTFLQLIGMSAGATGASSGSSVTGSGLKIPDTWGPKLATGAAYIPYDDFPARLHRGERVLTAQQNSEYSRGGVTITSSPSITIDARTDRAVVYGIVTEAVHQGNRALVEEMRAQGVIG